MELDGLGELSTGRAEGSATAWSGNGGAEGWINLSCTSVVTHCQWWWDMEFGWGGRGTGKLCCGFLCSVWSKEKKKSLENKKIRKKKK